MTTMKAILCTAYGSPAVLKLDRVPKPIPKDNELLIKIHATSVTSGDCEMRTCTMHPTMYPFFRLFVGITKPRKPILGMYFSGTIVSKGGAVDTYDVGAEVFGTTSFSMGTNAEFVCISDKAAIVHKPSNLTHTEAAAVPIGAWNALHFMNKADLKPGETILVFGAGGAIGTFAIQLAKSEGLKITAVDSAIKLDMLSEIGADHVVDYEIEDFTSQGVKYDVIFDVVGKSPYRRSLTCLKPNGRYILANVGFTPMLRGLLTNWISDKQVIFAMAAETKEELEVIKAQLEEGQIMPIIDRVVSLEEIPQAHSYIDSGQRQGNIVAKIA